MLTGAETAELPIGYVTIQGTIQDVDDMLALEEQSFTAPWSRKMFQGELSGNPFARFLLVREEREGRDGALAAYLCYWVVFEELRLMNVAVAPSLRRRGIATVLVRQAIREADRTGGKRALLEVRASNEAGRRLYQRLGFRETGSRKNYYTNPVEDAVLMALDPLTRVKES